LTTHGKTAPEGAVLVSKQLFSVTGVDSTGTRDSYGQEVPLTMVITILLVVVVGNKYVVLLEVRSVPFTCVT